MKNFSLIFTKKIIYFIIMSVLFSSCAAMLNSKFQKVKIVLEDPDVQLLIDNEQPLIKNDSLLLRRNKEAKQFTIKKDGYKDFDTAIVQRKLSPFAIFDVPLIIPLLVDFGLPKARDYSSKVYIKNNNVLKPIRDSIERKLIIIKVGLELQSIENEVSKYKYKNYNKSEKTYGEETNQIINIKNGENTIFTSKLNRILSNTGFNDTTINILSDNYLNSLMLEATIRNINFAQIGKQNIAKVYCAELIVDWNLMDYYGSSIYKLRTTNKSGVYGELLPIMLINDALHYGLLEVINTDSVKLLLKNKDAINDELFRELIIPKSSKYVSKMSEATKASVTVESDNGFGSGFFISENGYVITNYHVIKDSSNLKVITKSGEEFPAIVIRLSKIYDLALLKIDTIGVLPFSISESKKVVIASDIFAVGNSLNETFSTTISRGIISAYRNKNGVNLIQIDASINPGNSGGAIVNQQGIVVGVVRSKVIGFSVEGLAFGIPAYEILDKLKLNIE